MSIDRNIKEAKSKYAFSKAEDCNTLEERIEFCRKYLEEFSEHFEKEKKLVEPVPENASFKPVPVRYGMGGGAHRVSSYSTEVVRAFSEVRDDVMARTSVQQMDLEAYTKRTLAEKVLYELLKQGFIEFDSTKDHLFDTVRHSAKLRVVPPTPSRSAGPYSYDDINAMARRINGPSYTPIITTSGT